MLSSLWNQIASTKEDDSSSDEEDLNSTKEAGEEILKHKEGSTHRRTSTTSSKISAGHSPSKTFHRPSFLRSTHSSQKEDAEAAACFHRFPEYGYFANNTATHMMGRLMGQQSNEEERMAVSASMTNSPSPSVGIRKKAIQHYQHYGDTEKIGDDDEGIHGPSSSWSIQASNTFLDDVITLHNIKDTLDIFNLLGNNETSTFRSHSNQYNPLDGSRIQHSSSHTVDNDNIMHQTQNHDDMDSWNDEEANLWKENRNDTTRETVMDRSTENSHPIHDTSSTPTTIVTGPSHASKTSLVNHNDHDPKVPQHSRHQSWTNIQESHDTILPIQQQHQQMIPYHSSSSTTARQIYDEKSHWMPDVLCKNCYACESQFTMFRRRHHCRLCGQVFCSRCSSFFVEIVGGKINSQLKEVEEVHPMGGGTTSAIARSNSSNVTASATTNTDGDAIVTTATDSKEEDSEDVRTIRTCKMCYDQISARGPSGLSFMYGQEYMNPYSSQGYTGMDESKESLDPTSFDFLNLAMVRQRLEEKRWKMEQMEYETNDTTHLHGNALSYPTNPFRHHLDTLDRNSEKTLDPNTKDHTETAMEQDDTKQKEQDGAKEEIQQTHRELGLVAANHLEQLARELLKTDAPTLLKELNIQDDNSIIFKKWITTLMTLVTRVAVSVKPNVQNGDDLDIRPYCKVKVIPGGQLKDSCFVSGVVCHKNVSHKAMAREIINPRIMLLSGGIEFTRKENTIASLDTLLQQENEFLQILVQKITKVKPDVLMVGKYVSRKAQELLLKTNIVLLQNVKPELLDRVARQTGATILSSTDHFMNQFGASALGKCRRFRVVSFRDSDIWDAPSTESASKETVSKVTQLKSLIKNIDDKNVVEEILSHQKLPYHQRQAILAANLLGNKVHDGGEAMRSGIAKRGVTQTYAMIEGCPSHLGCTVVLRGASRKALKEVKRLLSFFVNMAYNLRLETSYFKCRNAVLCPEYKLPPRPAMSSSICVDYGPSPHSKKSRPWNGTDERYIASIKSLSGKVTALEHQSILIVSVWMTGKTQCCPAEVKGIRYYSDQDVSLGQFLRDSCFNMSLKCQNPTCKKSVLDHSLSFVHNDGIISITVEELEAPLVNFDTAVAEHEKNESSSESERPFSKKKKFLTWTYCNLCRMNVTPFKELDDETWNFSFGKFLEIYFYNKSMRVHSSSHSCSCNTQDDCILYFGCGNLAARFSYEKIKPYGVFLRKQLPFDEGFHKKFTVLELNEIMMSSSDLFERFNTSIEKTTKQTRELFLSAGNKPEHLQTVLSELSSISKEVEQASDILKEKIVSVTKRYNTYNTEAESGYSYGEFGSAALDAFSQFPWHARRYLFMLISAWNERLSVIGQALTAMKKVALASQRYVSGNPKSDQVSPINIENATDDVFEAMQRLRDVREIYSTLNVGDMSIQSNLASLLEKRLPQEENDEIDDEDFNPDVSDIASPEIKINFSEEVDADVLASRERLNSSSRNSSFNKLPPSENESRSRPKRSQSSPLARRDSSSNLSIRSQSPSHQRQKPVTAGGAVKSALDRLFNRGGKELDPYIVDLGIFSQGRPKLEAGVGGVVIPVFDEQSSTIIAHSLASLDYESQFRRHVRSYLKEINSSLRRSASVGAKDDDKNDKYIEAESLEAQRLDPKAKMRSNSIRRERSKRRGISGQKLSYDKVDLEKRMLTRNKTHIKHTFRDYDDKGNHIAKFVCTTFWATQFQAVRQAFLKSGNNDKMIHGSTYGKNRIEKNFVKSLSASLMWNAIGGKSGASFSKTSDDRFIIKAISRTELQMFLDCAPAYFEYLSKAFFHGLPTMLCKIVGVYQIGYHNIETGKRTMEQVAIMQNIFYGRNVSKVFDLKGSLRGRFAKNLSSNQQDKVDVPSPSPTPKAKSSNYASDSEISSDEEGETSNSTSDEESNNFGGESQPSASTLLDGDFIEFTGGRPLPLTDKAKAAFHMSILNDTLFLSIINVLDYSILVGIDEEKKELIVGIIDFMRQYDILKQMERVGKSIPMVVGSEAPTIIQPPLYKKRFINAMERYFMTAPNKWTTI